MDGYLKLLRNWRQLPEYSQLLEDHVADLQNRLEQVAVLAHHRLVKLQLEKSRYTLLNLLANVEEHLKKWNTKYGYESDVKNVLSEYKVRHFNLCLYINSRGFEERKGEHTH